MHSSTINPCRHEPDLVERLGEIFVAALLIEFPLWVPGLILLCGNF